MRRSLSLTILRLVLRINRWLHKPATLIHHEEVLQHLHEDGRITARYCVLTTLSSAIATLGLLQSSPAVVIGAMLISPLMLPMILFGFSFAVLDYHLTLQSLKAIALGILLSVLPAAIIVWFSPLTSVTPEILARIRPSFFDLLIAIFSGIAGAYAVAHRKGETIVGVAIATALMPPLAVMGYGLAVGNQTILAGSTGLFMTNLLAIGLTASLVAHVFGFSAKHSTKFWHILGIFTAFAVLSIPLGLSLGQIAQEAMLTNKARALLSEYFPPQDGRLHDMDIRFLTNGHIQIDALVLAQRPRPGIENDLRRQLEASLHRPVELLLSQAPSHTQEAIGRQAIEEMIGKSAADLATKPRPPDMIGEIALISGLKPLAISLDTDKKIMLLRQDIQDAERLDLLHQTVAVLSQRFPDWRVRLQFPLNDLPPISFAGDSTEADAPAQDLIRDLAWALHLAGVREVKVIGHSDTAKTEKISQGRALARAQSVAAALSAAGITARAEAYYPVEGQKDQERELGRAMFRTAVITAP